MQGLEDAKQRKPGSLDDSNVSSKLMILGTD